MIDELKKLETASPIKLFVENIRYIDYVNLKNKDKYNYYLRYGMLEPFDFFELGDFMELEFGFVKDMQEILNYTGLTWSVFITQMSGYLKKPMKQIAKEPLFYLQQQRLYIKDQIEKINKLESNNLGYTPTMDEERAGIEVFTKYKSFLQFDNLTGGDLLKIEAIKKLPYSICFAKMKLDADKAEFNRDLERIQLSKKKPG